MRGTVLVVALVLAPIAASGATLVGDVVDLEFINYGSDGSGPLGAFNSSAVVGPGVEFPTQISFDLDATSITLTGASNLLFLFPGEFDTYTLTDLDFDTGEIITGVSFSSNSVIGLTLDDVTFGPRTVSFVLDDTVWDQGTRSATLLLTTAVPEPSTALFLTCGLLGWAVTRRRSD